MATIKESLSQAKKRREGKRLSTITVKIAKDHLSKEAKRRLDGLFLEAKWLYNHTIADIEGRLNKETWKLRQVEIKVKDRMEKRKITRLSSQMRQGVVNQIWQNLKALKAIKENGGKVGRLKFKSEVRSIPHFRRSLMKEIISPIKIGAYKIRQRLRAKARSMKINGH